MEMKQWHSPMLLRPAGGQSLCQENIAMSKGVSYRVLFDSKNYQTGRYRKLLNHMMIEEHRPNSLILDNHFQVKFSALNTITPNIIDMQNWQN